MKLGNLESNGGDGNLLGGPCNHTSGPELLPSSVPVHRPRGPGARKGGKPKAGGEL